VRLADGAIRSLEGWRENRFRTEGFDDLSLTFSGITSLTWYPLAALINA